MSPLSSPVVLDVAGLTVVRSGRVLLDQVSFSASRGEVVGIVGPNGAGKSTLLGCLYRHVDYRDGSIRVDGQELRMLPRAESARLIAAMPQDTAVEFDLTVEEIVSAGTIPHRRADRARSRDVVEETLARVDLVGMRDRSVATLSGGERQRALLGRTLAQNAPILVLDEPTNHLDLAHQEQLLGLVHQHPGTSIIAIHDLNLAAEYCDRIVVMSRGRVVACGPPAEVMTAEMLAEVFAVTAQIIPHPQSGRPHLLLDSPRGGRAPR
ncbi:ABC transporter ATP-binding protein [Microbacterium sp. RD1]|uniref:ABC transporter ATP-binding protein n=1 Tax=Microbacterium sp. RD1 TaxID=3457313 RepID=UPI003FA5ED68